MAEYLAIGGPLDGKRITDENDRGWLSFSYAEPVPNDSGGGYTIQQRSCTYTLTAFYSGYDFDQPNGERHCEVKVWVSDDLRGESACLQVLHAYEVSRR